MRSRRTSSRRRKMSPSTEYRVLSTQYSVLNPLHLKRLDLVGFKSFGVHTSTEFQPGIVVIVGPNGSGKSNISDAVLWVLGEQSSKAVRARKPEEVIFAGSASRQPLGMAEASLVFDNEDRGLPI